MEIAFGDRKLAKAAGSERELVKKYGAQRARKIMTRLAVLEAAENLSVVPITPPDRCHQLSGDRDEEFSVDLDHPYRLIFRPNHDEIPRLEDGGIDLAAVKSIEILEIVDYH